MDFIQAFYLALVQGLTEFLPISSSAHLILMPVLFDWPDQGLAFDLAVHVGTLVAVVAYFRSQLWAMIVDWLASLKGEAMTDDARLAWYVIIGTIPVCVAGWLISDIAENVLRSPMVIALATIVFAIVLWVSEKWGMKVRGSDVMNWKDAAVFGVFQALALIPGTSRSGITITAGLFLGFNRDFSARFSFLLSIPAIVLPGTLKTLELIQTPDDVNWGYLLTGVAISATVAYLTIAMFLRLLEKVGLIPFVIYRIFLGFALFAVFY